MLGSGWHHLIAWTTCTRQLKKLLSNTFVSVCAEMREAFASGRPCRVQQSSAGKSYRRNFQENLNNARSLCFLRCEAQAPHSYALLSEAQLTGTHSFASWNSAHFLNHAMQPHVCQHLQPSLLQRWTLLVVVADETG